MLIDGDYTYCGEHIVMYMAVEPFYCIAETNIILYSHYINLKK